MEIKWTDRQYRVQDNADFAHKYVKIYCNTNQFPALPFCGPHSKPHSARGLSKHYHFLVLDQNANDNDVFSAPLRYEVWNVDHRRVVLGIDLCYNTSSHI